MIIYFRTKFIIEFIEKMFSFLQLLRELIYKSFFVINNEIIKIKQIYQKIKILLLKIDDKIEGEWSAFV